MLTTICDTLSVQQKRRIDAVSEQGASSWLSALPLKKYGFYLDNQSFRDSLFIRYGFQLENLPTKCVCGEAFNEVHALNCSRGGFLMIRHNDIRDLTAEFLSEVCHDVATEPRLTPLTGEQFVLRSNTVDDDARCDIAARGFWTRGN